MREFTSEGIWFFKDRKVFVVKLGEDLKNRDDIKKWIGTKVKIDDEVHTVKGIESFARAFLTAEDRIGIMI